MAQLTVCVSRIQELLGAQTTAILSSQRVLSTTVHPAHTLLPQSLRLTRRAQVQQATAFAVRGALGADVLGMEVQQSVVFIEQWRFCGQVGLKQRLVGVIGAVRRGGGSETERSCEFF